ncbi:MAG: PSD1 domain-containing protein [Planctomycetales bacterium]|nr:PSD1 domain-containing protein [Planctomycetales bacterium]
MNYRNFCLLWLLFGSLDARVQASSNDQLFESQIAPILQARCISCHNDQQNAGDLSLQHSWQLEDSGSLLTPGNAETSRLLEAIELHDGEAQMPKDAAPLSITQIELIREWINAGASWEPEFHLSAPLSTSFDWWSFKQITRPSVPTVDDMRVSNPVDAFVLSKLRENQLDFSFAADRRSLIRRLYFDLLGSPPTYDEVAKFVSDEDPQAYERLVDRLLASEHYGERWARHWLDVVKYADTCGYDKDKLRNNAWPYRDYIIRSFNDDKPFVRFVQEQVAGDALFPGQADGILGLGFIAAGPWDFIGHVEVPETKLDGLVARNLDRDDMVTNCINTFCSLTIQCARCHDHKFDPFTQRDYYELQAIFAAVDRAERSYDLDPLLVEEKFRLQASVKRCREGLKAIDESITAAGGEELATLRREAEAARKEIDFALSPEFGYHSGLSETQDNLKWVEVQLPHEVELSSIILHPCYDDFAGIRDGFGFPLRYQVTVSGDFIENQSSDWRIAFDRTQTDVPSPGIQAIEIPYSGPPVRRIRVTATKLAPRKDDFNFALAELSIKCRGQDFVWPKGTHVSALDSIDAPVRWARNNLIDGLWPKASDPDSYKNWIVLSRKLESFLRELESQDHSTHKESLQKELASAEEALKQLPEGKMVYAAATHFLPQGNFKPTSGIPRQINLLMRGEVNRPGDVVDPGVLSLGEQVFEKLTSDASDSDRRSMLAKWLTQADHPLLWRSIANRLWQYHFGAGIVSTPNDFGRMGDTPTHPELLDWLACELRDAGGSLKHIHRLIVTSWTYRQSSASHADYLRTDGENRYLWRMNRRRLEAEEIRDSMLQVANLLNNKMGGPGFPLFELEKTEHSPHFEYYKYDPNNPDSHRRSIYRFVVRSQPNPWMMTLDCADSSQSTPRRSETITPLHALTMFNNRFNLMIANRLASYVSEQRTDLNAQIEYSVQLTLQRMPTRDEQVQLLAHAEKYGLEDVCRVLINLSEFVYLD